MLKTRVSGHSTWGLICAAGLSCSSKDYLGSGPPPQVAPSDPPPVMTTPTATADVPPSVPDVPADAGTPLPDADAPPELGDFGDPQVLSELSLQGYQVDDPSLTGDMLEIFFGAEMEPNVGGLWSSRRESIDAPWEPPTEVVEVGELATPWILPDGLTLYFSSLRAGGDTDFDVWRANRPSRNSAWEEPELVTALNSALLDEAPSVSWSGLSLTMTRRTRESVTTRDIFISSRAAANAVWSPPVVLELFSNAEVDETDPFLSADELILYFATKGANDAPDIFFAVRSTLSEGFANPKPLENVNSEAEEEDPWVSRDGREIYFASDRGGNLELYHATR